MNADLKDILARARIVPDLTSLLPPEAEFHLVGGALRDFLLGRSMADFDFAGPFDPTPLARAFAERIGGHWFPLDPTRQQSRVVRREGGEMTTYDFAPYRGPDLIADLRERDFTFNALVLPLSPGGGALLDPLGGMEDLQNRRLRGCSAGVFAEDPLRVLKGVRHAVTLGCDFEAETTDRMREAVSLLRRVAPERIRAEVGKIFAAEPVVSAISLLQDFNLLPILFTAAGADGSAAGGSALAGRMEQVLAAAHPFLGRLAEEEFEAGFGRHTLLKLAAFLHGWQPDDPGLAVGQIRLGRRATAAIRHLLELPAGKGEEVDRLPDLERSRALWAADAGGSVPDTLLFFALLRPDPPAEAFARLEPILRDWLWVARDGRVPDLVDGHWAREALGVPEGPGLGEALAALRQEEIAGRVRTPEEGKKFLLRRREKD